MDPLELFPKAQQAAEAKSPPTPLILTVEAAAERLGIGRTLMYALVKSGAIESVSIGRLRRIPADALESFVQSLRASNSDKVA
jgi:excisionase family DNA binding protein